MLLSCKHLTANKLQMGHHCSHVEIECKTSVTNTYVALKDRKDFDIITSCCESPWQVVAQCSSSWIACLLFKTLFQKFLLVFLVKQTRREVYVSTKRYSSMPLIQTYSGLRQVNLMLSWGPPLSSQSPPFPSTAPPPPPSPLLFISQFLSDPVFAPIPPSHLTPSASFLNSISGLWRLHPAL